MPVAVAHDFRIGDLVVRARLRHLRPKAISVRPKIGIVQALPRQPSVSSADTNIAANPSAQKIKAIRMTLLIVRHMSRELLRE